MNNKLVFVIHGLPMGGAEKFLISLLNYLSVDSYEVHLILLSNQEELRSELIKKVLVYKVLKASRYDLFVSKRLKKLVETIDPASIVCINTYAYFLTKLGFIFSNEYAVILSPHTTKPFSFYNYLQNVIYYRFVGKRDKIIYLCKAQMSYLKKLYHIGCHQRYIIYNGIDMNYFNPDSIPQNAVKQLRENLGIQKTDAVIVQVARIQPEKRHQDSINALAELLSLSPRKVHILFVGGGNIERVNYLKRLARQLHIDKNVHFLNNQQDVRLFYKAADLFTLTSESETFSLAALEAMSFGLPVVITDVGGASEMVSNYQNGFLVPVRNTKSLVKAWDKALSLHFNSNQIREKAIKDFSIDKMKSRYADVLSGAAQALINI